MRKIPVMISSLCCGLALNAAELPLAVDGREAITIQVHPEAAPPVRYAAEELQQFIREITGAEPYISRQAAGGQRTTLVLVCPKMLEDAKLRNTFQKDLEAIGDTDGYAVRASGRVISIVAPTAKGILNGAYDFLERNTDIIFMRPNAPAIFGRQPNLKAVAADFIAVPKFVQRGFQINIETRYEASERYLARNRNNYGGEMNPNYQVFRQRYAMWQEYGGGHNLPMWIPAKKYAESNPDFFPLIGGERKFAFPIQLCFTNKKLAQEMARNVMEAIRQAPFPEYYASYNIMVNDCEDLCECPECRKPIPLPDGGELKPDDPAFRSTQHFMFINRVAELVGAEFPKVKINCYAYIFSAIPPKVALAPNVIVRYCIALRDDKEAIDGESNAKWLAWTREWSRQKADLIWREYFGLGAAFCRPISETVARDLQIINELNIKRVFAESSFNENPDRHATHHPFDVSAMEYWVISRLYWDPYQDVEKLRDEFLRRSYREAFEPMREFFALIRKSWYATRRASFFLDSPVKSADYYIIQAGLETPCRKALEQAEQIALHPESKKQIQATRRVFEYWVETAPKMRTPEINVPRVKGPVALTSDCWKNAGTIDGFNIMNTTEPAKYKTVVKMIHDNSNLYLAFTCDNPDTKALNGKKPPVPHDAWPNGEHVEFFIDGNLAEKGGYYMFAFNVFGLKYDGIGADPKWDGAWDVQVNIEDTRWTALMTIPLATLGVNVTQQSKLNGTLYKQTNTGKIHEGASWGGAAVHAPAGFGQFNLAWE